MPAKSKAQQRFFGMIDAYKKGKLKHAPKKIREASKHVSDEDARDFAKTKHDGLPEKVEQKSAAFIAGFLAKCASAGIDVDAAGELYKRAYAVVRRPDGTLVQYGSRYGTGVGGTPMRSDGTRGVVIGRTTADPKWAKQEAAKSEAAWRKANGIPNGISTEEAVAIKRRNLERARKEWSDTSTAYGRDNAVVNRYRAPDNPDMSYDEYVANRDKYRTRVDPHFGQSVAQSVKAPRTADQIMAASKARAQSPGNMKRMAGMDRMLAERAQRQQASRPQIAKTNPAPVPKPMAQPMVAKAPAQTKPVGADFWAAENTHSGRPAMAANPPVQKPLPVPGTPSAATSVAGAPATRDFWSEGPSKSKQLSGYKKPTARTAVAPRKPKAPSPKVGYNGIRSPWGNSVMYRAMS